MYFLKFSVFILFVTTFLSIFAEGINLTSEFSSPLLNSLRSKRSPIPDPHHHRYRTKVKARYKYYYDAPSYHISPVVVPVVKPIVVSQPVYRPVVVAKPVYSGGCYACGKGYGNYGGYGGSQASSQASSHSFSAGLHSPFGGLGFSSSYAQSSANSGAGWG